MLHAFGGRHFGVASRRTPLGGLTLHASRPVARGQPLLEIPISSCLAHASSASLDTAVEGVQHSRTGLSRHQRRLQSLLQPTFRSRGHSYVFGHFGEWLRLTSTMMTGLSASTESGTVFSLHPFEAAVALTILEGATICTPRYNTSQWHYIQTLPLAQFLYQGGDPARRQEVVASLAGDAPEEQVSLFHAAHMCLELIGSNLADIVLRKYDHTERDEQLEWMAQATLLTMRSRLSVLPVFANKPRSTATACEFYRPFIVPVVDMLRHSFDLETQVNCKVYADLAAGCVRAEALRNVRAGEELYVLHPAPSVEELPGMDDAMGLVLRYGMGANV